GAREGEQGGRGELLAGVLPRRRARAGGRRGAGLAGGPRRRGARHDAGGRERPQVQQRRAARRDRRQQGERARGVVVREQGVLPHVRARLPRRPPPPRARPREQRARLGERDPLAARPLEEGSVFMRALGVVALLALLAAPARAERTQVFSVQGADCGDCGKEILATLKKTKGVKRASWDLYKVEISTVLADGVTDDQVVRAIQSASKEFTALVGAGQGRYLPQEKYPEGADVVVLTESGAAVGPLE